MRIVFRISNDMFEKLQALNEKYNVLCFDLENESLLETDGFFDVIMRLNTEPEDRYYIEYAFNICDLCLLPCKSDEDVAEWKANANEAWVEYRRKLAKLEKDKE